MHSNRTVPDPISKETSTPTLLSKKLQEFYDLGGVEIKPNFTLKKVMRLSPEIIHRGVSIIVKTTLHTLESSKTVILKSSNSDEDPNSATIDEAIVMKKLQFTRNIAEISGICNFDDAYWIVMKPYQIDLRHFLTNAKKQNISISLKQKYTWAKDISYGLNHIHQRYIHRDIKGLNIFLDEDNSANIGDFGTILPISHPKQTKSVGTTAWMAPEVLINNEYTTKSDIYSFGIVLWEIATGDVPYLNCSEIYIIKMKTIQKKEILEIPQDCDSTLKKLIIACCNYNPDGRPSAQTVGDTLDAALKELSLAEPEQPFKAIPLSEDKLEVTSEKKSSSVILKSLNFNLEERITSSSTEEIEPEKNQFNLLHRKTKSDQEAFINNEVNIKKSNPCLIL